MNKGCIMTALRSAPRGLEVTLACLALFALAVALRLIDLDYPPRTDELYTMLAARSWLAEGEPRIADGLYYRAELYTILIAGLFGAFGEGLVVARMLSVVANALLVVAVFLWVRAFVGGSAAWIAALFVALAPLSILVAQTARFYALHALAFWLAAIGVYTLVEQRPAPCRAVLIGLATAASFAVAFHLQMTTLVGGVGLVLWSGVTLALPWLLAKPAGQRRLALGLGMVASGGLLAFLYESGLFGLAWNELRRAPLHSLPHADAIWFYHLNLIELYPSLWPLFPFLILLALGRALQPTLFACSVFAVALAVLSLGGMKHLVYIHFVFPFLFVIWAIALVEAYNWLAAIARTAAAGALLALLPERAGPRACSVLIALGLAFLVISNGAPARTLLKPLGITLRQDQSSIDWRPVPEALGPLAEEVEMLLSPNDVHALYYLNRLDVVPNASRQSESSNPDEFALDPRTGRPVIGNVGSLALILDCYRDGLVVGDATDYGVPWGLNREMIALLEARADPVPLPPAIWGFHWSHGDAFVAPGHCARMPPTMPLQGTDGHGGRTRARTEAEPRSRHP